jgi:hypothetical protein
MTDQISLVMPWQAVQLSRNAVPFVRMRQSLFFTTVSVSVLVTVQSLVDLLFRFDGDRIDDHTAFRFLDLVNLNCLPLDAHIPMNNPDAALLGQADSGFRFCYRVHGGAQDGYFERD